MGVPGSSPRRDWLLEVPGVRHQHGRTKFHREAKSRDRRDALCQASTASGALHSHCLPKPPSYIQRRSAPGPQSDLKHRDTCNSRGASCYRPPRGETSGRWLRPRKGRFRSREIPVTIRQPVLAGFSKAGLEVAGVRRLRSEPEEEIWGSQCWPRVLHRRRRSPKELGEHRLASLTQRPVALPPLRTSPSRSPRVPLVAALAGIPLLLPVASGCRRAMLGGRPEVALAAIGPPASHLAVLRLPGVTCSRARPLPLAGWIPRRRSPARKPQAKTYGIQGKDVLPLLRIVENFVKQA